MSEKGISLKSQMGFFLVLILAVGSAALLIGGSLREAPKPVNPEPDLAKAAREDLARRNFAELSAPLAKLVRDDAFKPVPTQSHPLLGEKSPDFKLMGVDGLEHTLSTLRNERPLILVFYYGYHCDHCVSQLFGLEKDRAYFEELGASIVAISPDAPSLTQQRFKKYGAFHYTVLSDPANAVALRYGAFKPAALPQEEGDNLHATFIIDAQGTVIWANFGDAPFTDNRTLLHTISHMAQKR